MTRQAPLQFLPSPAEKARLDVETQKPSLKTKVFCFLFTHSP